MLNAFTFASWRCLFICRLAGVVACLFLLECSSLTMFCCCFFFWRIIWIISLLLFLLCLKAKKNTSQISRSPHAYNILHYTLCTNIVWSEDSLYVHTIKKNEWWPQRAQKRDHNSEQQIYDNTIILYVGIVCFVGSFIVAIKLRTHILDHVENQIYHKLAAGIEIEKERKKGSDWGRERTRERE